MSAFIDEQRERFGVEPVCRVLGVSASAYYQRASGERSARQVDDERLLELIRELHRRNYFAYGSWRMWKALLRTSEQVGRGRVERLMRANGNQGAKRRGKPWRTTYPSADAYRPADLVERDFTASRTDELWFADFTYLRCWEGVVYFAFVIDAYSRAIVGWQFATHMRTDLVLDALRMALAMTERVEEVTLVHHSDAGSQYTSFTFGKRCEEAGVRPSMGTVGDCFDNAMCEAFSPRSNASCSTGAVSRPRPGPALRSSILLNGGTTPVAAIRRSTIYRPSTTRGVISIRPFTAAQPLPKRSSSKPPRGRAPNAPPGSRARPAAQR